MGTGQIDSRRGVQKEAGIRRVGTRQIHRRRVVQNQAGSDEWVLFKSIEDVE